MGIWSSNEVQCIVTRYQWVSIIEEIGMITDYLLFRTLKGSAMILAQGVIL